MHKFKKYSQFISDYRFIQLLENDVCEKHHIKLKSLGGGNEKENMIRLKTFDHMKAHYYLWEDAYQLYKEKQIDIKTYKSITAATKFLLRLNNNQMKLEDIDDFYIESMVQLRQEWIRLISGPNNHNYGKKMSEETRKKLSIVKLGVSTITKEGKEQLRKRMKGNKHSLGNIPSEETRKKLSIAGKGRKHSKETRCKIGEANRGKIVSQETKEKLRLVRLGTTHTAQSKELMSKKKRKENLSEETRRKYRERFKGIKSPSFGGYYITPFGKFASKGEIKDYINKNKIDVIANTIYNWCKDGIIDGTYYKRRKTIYNCRDFWFEPVLK